MWQICGHLCRLPLLRTFRGLEDFQANFQKVPILWNLRVRFSKLRLAKPRSGIVLAACLDFGPEVPLQLFSFHFLHFSNFEVSCQDRRFFVVPDSSEPTLIFASFERSHSGPGWAAAAAGAARASWPSDSLPTSAQLLPSLPGSLPYSLDSVWFSIDSVVDSTWSYIVTFLSHFLIWFLEFAFQAFTLGHPHLIYISVLMTRPSLPLAFPRFFKFPKSTFTILASFLHFILRSGQFFHFRSSGFV